MGYIGDMTTVLLDEITLAERLMKYCDDVAYGNWFNAKAKAMVEQIHEDFDYFCEVTEITKKSASDQVAYNVYHNLYDRIEVVTAQVRGHS